MSADNFRQRLSRARRQLLEFAQGHCGLVDAGNRCRCARKTRAFIRDGIVDPKHLVFARPHVARMQEASSRGRVAFERAVENAGVALWRDQPMLDPTDLVTRLRGVLFRGDRGRMYREPADWLASARMPELLER